MAVHRTNIRWRFHKILCFSQNIWTLKILGSGNKRVLFKLFLKSTYLNKELCKGGDVGTFRQISWPYSNKRRFCPPFTNCTPNFTFQLHWNLSQLTILSGNLNLHIKVDLGCSLILTHFSSVFETLENSDVGDNKVFFSQKWKQRKKNTEILKLKNLIQIQK